MNIRLLKEFRSKRGVKIIFMPYCNLYLIEEKHILKSTTSNPEVIKEEVVWRIEQFKDFSVALTRAHREINAQVESLKYILGIKNQREIYP